MSFLPQLTKGGHSRPEPSTKPAVGLEHGKVTNRSSRLLLLLLLPDCSRHPPHTHTHTLQFITKSCQWSPCMDQLLGSEAAGGG